MTRTTMRLRDLPEDVNQVSGEVIDSAICVHKALGPGLLESAYKACLAHELRHRGLRVDREVAIAIRYGDLVVPAAYFADLVVEGSVIVEAKAVENLHPVDEAQLLTYMRWLKIPLGILLNFHAPRLMENGFVRRVLKIDPEPNP